MSTTLQLDHVTKHYPGFDFGPVDFTLEPGLVTGLVGANGAGKTTLVKLALGLVHPDAGTVAPVDRDRLGVVYDVPALWQEWKVTQVGEIIGRFYPSWDANTFSHYCSWAGLQPNTKIKNLSRGMGMKLQVAVAMSHQAELLVLDEPTAGLDPIARTELLDMLAEFMTDPAHTVLFSSHITTDLDRLADRLVIISGGRVLLDGVKDELVEGHRKVRGARADLEAVRPYVHGLREHATGWEGLMATEHTASLGPSAAVEAPTIEDLVVHLAKEPSHV